MAFTQPTSQRKFLRVLYHPQFSIPPPPYTMAAPPFGHQQFMQQAPPANVFGGDDSDEEEDLSPIKIFIETPVHVSGDNNMVGVDAGLTASKVADALVSSLKQMSSASGGVPMIDQDGRPRPITVKVKAETKIEGSRNVVGERAVLSTLQATGAKKKTEDTKDGIKRGRAGSEPLTMVSKRVKKE